MGYPLFHADRIETPLVMMLNDNDGAVLWDQGTEMFVAMRCTGKEVWLVRYTATSRTRPRGAGRYWPGDDGIFRPPSGRRQADGALDGGRDPVPGEGRR
jgi:hypothetical protein